MQGEAEGVVQDNEVEQLEPDDAKGNVREREDELIAAEEGFREETDGDITLQEEEEDVIMSTGRPRNQRMRWRDTH